MNSSAKRNVPFIIVTVVVWLFLIGAAIISFSHIVHVSKMLGLDWEAWIVPGLIDGIAIVGKVSQLDRFAESARKSGRRLVLFGGLLSLAANVAAGSNWGQRAFGVLVVAGFLVLESHATKLRPAPAAVVEQPTRKLDPAVAAERAAKARATRERNRLAAMTPAQKAAETRRRNREIDAEFAEMTGSRPGNAPVSPAV